MEDEGRILTFQVEEPYPVALRMLRRALAQEGLRVPCELDTSERVKQELGIGLKPNIVLYVDDPMILLEATVMNPSGSLFVPEPVVLSSQEKGSRVALRAVQPLPQRQLPASLRGAVLNLHERIMAAVQRIGQKEQPVTPVAEQKTVAV